MSISVNSEKIEIRVDKRTELLGIIQIISDYRKQYPELLEKHGNLDYIEEIESKFSKYKDHKVIKLFNEIVSNNNFGYDAPVSLFLQLNDDFTLDKLDDYPFITRLNSDPRVLELLSLSPDFAREIDFESFYASNEERYKKFLNNIKSQFDGKDIVSFMLDYYGVQTDKKFVVNLIPFQSNANYGTRNGNEIYSNMCGIPDTLSEDGLYPSIRQNGNVGYVSLLYHEFSHSFINPLTDKHSIINDDDQIFSEIFEVMHQQAYGSNRSIINEHLVRATTIRYRFHDDTRMNKADTNERYNIRTQYERESGFIYIDNILESLVFYENNRDKFETIGEFYPVIIENMQIKHKETEDKKGTK